MKGYIYIMTNPGYKDELVKIGYAEDPEKRRKELSKKSCVPADFEIYATYEVNEKLKDKKLHEMIDQLNPDLRFRSNREFYQMPGEDAYNMLQAIAEISHTEKRLKKFEKSPVKSADSLLKKHFNNEKFYIHRNSKGGIDAECLVKNDKIYVLKGSKIGNSARSYIAKSIQEERDKFYKNYILDKDVVFNSISGAGVFVLGYNVNGYLEWKNKDDITIHELLKRL